MLNIGRISGNTLDQNPSTNPILCEIKANEENNVKDEDEKCKSKEIK